MLDEYELMFEDLSKLQSNEKNVTGNDVLEVLKKYPSAISVFDMMALHPRSLRRTSMFRKIIVRTVRNHTLNHSCFA